MRHGQLPVCRDGATAAIALDAGGADERELLGVVAAPLVGAVVAVSREQDALTAQTLDDIFAVATIAEAGVSATVAFDRGFLVTEVALSHLGYIPS